MNSLTPITSFVLKTFGSFLIAAVFVGSVSVSFAEAYAYPNPPTSSGAVTSANTKCTGAFVANLGGEGDLSPPSAPSWSILAWGFIDGTLIPSGYNTPGSYCIQGELTSNSGSWNILYKMYSGAGTASATKTYALTYINASPAPTTSISLAPTSISAGYSSALTWSSTNATSCTGTGFSTGGALSGTVSVSPSQTTTYSVSCTGAGGTAQGSATLTVTPPSSSPSILLTASPSSVTAGGSTTLSWTSSNTSYCSSTQFDTAGATSGSITITPNASTNYTLTCTGSSGSGTGTWQYYQSDYSDLSCPVSSSNNVYSSVPDCPASPQGKSCTSPPSTCKVNTIGPGCGITTDLYSCQVTSPPPSVSGSAYVTVSSTPLTASCAVSPTSVYTEEMVTWIASASGGTGSYTYSWSGTDSLSGTGASVSKTYSTTGTKSGAVTITSGGNSAGVSCSNSVAVSVVLSDLSASAISPTSAITNVAKTFSATITNAGNPATGGEFINLFQRATSSSGANTEDIGTGMSPNISTNSSEATTFSYAFPSAGTWYVRACADKNSSTGSGVINESNETNNCGAWTAVTVAIPSLNTSCAVAPTSGYTNDNITWTASPAGGTGSYTYSWSGTDGLSGTTQSVVKQYTTVGTKAGSVIVASGTQSVTQACSNSTSISASPTALLSATPSSIIRGQNASQLTWSSTNATSCTSTNFATGGQTSGALSVTPTNTTTYNLTCTNASKSAYSSAVVTVYVADLVLTASPNTSVRRNDSVIINWSVSGSPDSCLMSGPGLSSGSFSGSQSVIIGQESTYTFSCTTGGGTTSKSITVKLLPAYEEF
ncbi:MAG: CARDB domain-containing protein [Candidatus Paceibacterota bacterium]